MQATLEQAAKCYGCAVHPVRCFIQRLLAESLAVYDVASVIVLTIPILWGPLRHRQLPKILTDIKEGNQVIKQVIQVANPQVYIDPIKAQDKTQHHYLTLERDSIKSSTSTSITKSGAKPGVITPMTSIGGNGCAYDSSASAEGCVYGSRTLTINTLDAELQIQFGPTTVL